MVTVRILGGLGNQLFEYAFGRQLALKKKTDLCLDYYYQMIRTDFDGEHLTRITDIFDLPVKVYLGKARKKFVDGTFLKSCDRLFTAAYVRTRCLVTENNYQASHTQIVKARSVYVTGHWQSERYFSDIAEVIRSDLRFNMEEKISGLGLYQDIAGSHSVSLHIRGQDYVGHPWYEKLAIGYYQKAVEHLNQKHKDLKFFIFTDDRDYVRQQYEPLLRFSTLVDVKTDLAPDAVELLLMSVCKHNVICNSSFSWWGAWLNRNPSKIVVAPRRWFIRPDIYNEEMILPEAWHKI